MIPLHRPVYETIEQEYLASAMEYQTGQTSFCELNEKWLASYTGRNAILTNSCTAALEMSAELLHAQPGMEVIMPSFTFSSTANAFVKAGLIPVFVDIRKDTLNLDENKLEEAITDKTVAIVPMHYAGIACEMDKITDIAKVYKLAVIEDAAQALGARYKGEKLGSIGDFGCVSFHETKNFSMGEGGAFFCKDKVSYDEAVIYAECGTNRRQLAKGEIREYSWIEKGTSCIPSELACKFLYPQLMCSEKIISDRLDTWNYYYDSFKVYGDKEWLEIPVVPEYCEHNGHIFHIRVKDKTCRDNLLDFLRENGVMAAFHYIPLHSSPAGRKYGRFHGTDKVTTKASESLIRLPLYYGMKQEDKEKVVEVVDEWLHQQRKAGML